MLPPAASTADKMKTLKKLNFKEVRRATTMFWCTFLLLLIFSIIPVYFFLKSYQSQNDYIVKDINSYKELLNKHQLLKQKIDSVYNQLSLLNTGKVSNDLFLEKYIADNKNEIVRIIGDDSTKDFKQYGYLMNNIEGILKQKDTLIGISNRESLALSDLMDCMNKTRKVKKDLSFDPARSFSGAK